MHRFRPTILFLLLPLLLWGCVGDDPAANPYPNGPTLEIKLGNDPPPLQEPNPSKVIVQLESWARPITSIAQDHQLLLDEQLDDDIFILHGNHNPTVLVVDPDIKAASTDQAVETQGTDGTFGFYEGEGWGENATPNQSALSRLRLEQLHQIATGAGVRVMVADTGIDPEHPFIIGNIEPLNHTVYGLGSAEPVPDDFELAPAFGHGTHVVGCLVQAAPDVTVVPARILNEEGYGSLRDFIRMLVAARDPALDLDILSLSVSTANHEQIVQNLVEELGLADLIVVAAAGNYPSGTSPVPAPSVLCQYGNVYAVAAVDEVDVLAPFSRYGATLVDFAAPGVEIYSSVPIVSGFSTSGYRRASGTSYATPLASGSIACVMEAAGLGATDAALEIAGDCRSTTPENVTEHGRVHPKGTSTRLTEPEGGGVPALPN